jgi:hypothetical protein
MPYKVYADGDRWDAADANLVMQQSVMTFPTAADRDAAIPNPTDGMVVWCAGTLWQRAGGYWNRVTPDLPANGVYNGGFEIGALGDYWMIGTTDGGNVAELSGVVFGDAGSEGQYVFVLNTGTGTGFLQSMRYPRSGMRAYRITCIAKAWSGDINGLIQVVNKTRADGELDYPGEAFTLNPGQGWNTLNLNVPVKADASYFHIRVFNNSVGTVLALDDFQIIPVT